jgi:hypothetical protein
MPKRKVADAKAGAVPLPSGPPLNLPDGDLDEIESQRLLLDPKNLRLLEVAADIMDTPAKLIGQISVQDRLYEPAVRQSLQTLPCFVLQGTAISGDEQRLSEYRRASEIYVGMRHLMGAKSWEPASRYEFQARLVQEGWTIQQVSERFGRSIPEVRRDLRAQTLYRDFRDYERQKKLRHTITYNAFAEAARASSIMNWIGWTADAQQVENPEYEQAFFDYLVVKLRLLPKEDKEAPGDDVEEESAETVVRRLRDMLRLGDEDIMGAVLDRQFETADMLFEDRKQGVFAKRIQSYIRGVRRATTSELAQNPEENQNLLKQLQIAAQTAIDLIDGILRRR